MTIQVEPDDIPNEEFDQFENLTKKLLAVSKEQLDEKRKEEAEAREGLLIPDEKG